MKTPIDGLHFEVFNTFHDNTIKVIGGLVLTQAQSIATEVMRQSGIDFVGEAKKDIRARLAKEIYGCLEPIISDLHNWRDDLLQAWVPRSVDDNRAMDSLVQRFNEMVDRLERLYFHGSFDVEERVSGWMLAPLPESAQHTQEELHDQNGAGYYDPEGNRGDGDGSGASADAGAPTPVCADGEAQ